MFLSVRNAGNKVKRTKKKDLKKTITTKKQK